MQEIFFIGMGPGSSECMSLQAQKLLSESSQVIVWERQQSFEQISACPHAQRVTSLTELKTAILQSDPQKSLAICVSGSPCFHSVAGWLCKQLESSLYNFAPHFLPAVSSVEYFKALLMSEPYRWYEVASYASDSLHAQGVASDLGAQERRAYCRSRFLKLLRKQLLSGECGLFILPDPHYSFTELLEDLYNSGLRTSRLAYGELLSTESERVYCSSLEELYKAYQAGEMVQQNDSITLIALEFDEELKLQLKLDTFDFGLKDEEFERSATVPMTKSEIRAFIASRMRLHVGALCWDVGAGSGSVSIELARMHPSISVYAVESKEEAYRLTNVQTQRFNLQAQLYSVWGAAPAACETLPAPSHVFLGGGSQALPDIVELACRKYEHDERLHARPLRFVATAVSLSSLGSLYELFSQDNFSELEIVQLSANRFKKLGSVQLMDAQNPIFIFSANYSCGQ